MKNKLLLQSMMVLLCTAIYSGATANIGSGDKYISSKSLKTLITNESKSEGTIDLTEALDRISRTYEVYFTFDRELTAQYDVDYEESKYSSAEEAIQLVLKETNLAYQIFDEQFVIIYRNDKAGLESVKQMISHLQGFVMEKETAAARPTHKQRMSAVSRLQPRKLNNSELKAYALSVTGTVTDQTGEPLIGVNILVKGTNKGTTTDFEGRFSLEDVDENAVLIFSYIGYQTQEVPIAGKSTFSISLKEDLQTLDEVVVIGYGTQKRRDFTGSVSSFKMEDSPVSLLSNSNALEALKGNISGLNIGPSNSAGDQPSVLIRGQNSISGSNTPLIVLDGIIFLGSLNDIDPNDIASFDVLKDAVSAAAYGSRSANGIIAITTKKGRMGKPVINVKATSGIETWLNMPMMMKGDQWIQVVNARNQFADGTTSWMKSGELANLEAGNETTWLDLATRTGITQNYQLGVSGAGESINYYLSSTYSQNKGVVVGDDFNRLSLLGKVNTNITDWLEIGIDGAYSRRNYSGFGASLSTAQVMSPYGVVYRDNEKHLEKYPYTQSGVNPLWGVDDNTRNNNDIRQNIRLNSYAVVDIPWISGLNYRINLSVNKDNNNYGEFYFEDFYVAEGEGLQRYEPSTLVNFLTNANGRQQDTKNQSYVIDNILHYSNDFEKHHIEGTLVATRDYLRHENINTTGNDFASNGSTTLGMWGLHKATVQKVDLNAYERANIGYLGRFNYSFNDTYYLTGSYRRDGASVFGAQNKWADFFASGVAWRISQEPFLTNVTSLNELKIKLSWGQNGNQGIGPYTTLSQIANGSSGGIRYEFSDQEGKIQYGLIQSTLGNQELGWESTESWNGGIESAWLKNRLFIDLDVYFSKTTDQIFQRFIPVMTGFKTVLASLGQINNTGVDLTVKSLNVMSNNFTWTSLATFWKNNNKLVELYGEDLDGDGIEDDDISNSLFIGESLGAIYGYEQDGIVQEGDSEYSALTGASPGDPKYKDLDGVDGITADDRTILGFSKENFRLNLSNTLTYKDFELYVLASGIFGGDNYFLKNNSQAYLTSGTGLFNANMTYKPYWTPENMSNTYPSATFSGDGRFRGLQSRSFVRIQDITLSYNVGERLKQAMKLQSLQVFFTAKNLATFTSWEGGDPETGTTYLSGTYPVMSTFSVGANVRF